jgi:error-prone DNA polymerase
MPQDPDYAELYCRSNFTFLTGASHPEELVRRARELGYRALALTDECSLAGVVRAHVEAKAQGLALILGSSLRLADGPELVLLAENREGYGNLAHLITRGRRQAEKGHYRLTRGDLAAGLSDCLALWLPDPEPDPADGRWLAAALPGRVWIGVQQHRTGADAERLARLRRLGAETGLPLAAAGGVLMHVRERRVLQDTLTAIRLGLPLAQAGYALSQNGERHLRTRAELAHYYRSEERRVGKECRRLCRSRWSPYH